MASPPTHRALLLTSHDAPPSIVKRETQPPGPGSISLRPLAAPVLSYSIDIYPPHNTRGYRCPLPLVPGSSAVARIEALPPDTSNSLRPGQLVLLSTYVRGREDSRSAPAPRYLLGVHEGHTESSANLMRTGHRDGAFAEITTAPVENVFALDEARLLGRPEHGGLGLDPARLSALLQATVPFGGFRSVLLKPGEIVAVAPSTGAFGRAAVAVALAMGARVVAMGRSDEGLAQVAASAKKSGKEAQLRTVKMSGDSETDAAALRKEAGMGGLDVFFDISPPMAVVDGKTPAYIRAGLLALRHGGRMCLMGGIPGDLTLPYTRLVQFDITVKGKWMYEPDDVRDLIKMVESGTFGFEWMEVAGRFPLEDWEKAWKTAESHGGQGQITVIEPQT